MTRAGPLLLLVLVTGSSALQIPKQELDNRHWVALAERDLEAALSRRQIDHVAKNVILFIGDGMSLSTVTAARIFKGQLQGHPGEESKLVFEDFPNVALSKTYNVDHQVSDSAATATAFLCGVKAQYGTIGVGSGSRRGDCPASKVHRLKCLAEVAQDAGMRTGVVTTSRITHATPAPLYSYSADRQWETDSLQPEVARKYKCPDIASQLTDHVGRKMNVLLGGGRKSLLPITESDPEHAHKVGLRMDGRNIISEWLSDKHPDRAKYVWNRRQFKKIDPDRTDYLLGLFEHSHMNYEGDRLNDTAGEPSLAEMTQKAIEILDRGSHGYFLLVEAARIDHAHHENTAHRALEETLALDQAVSRVLDLVDPDETLIIVTSDHSHPLTIGSYATRGNPILGLTDYSNEVTRDHLSDVDFKPHTTLSYANGPGYDRNRPRKDLTHTDTSDRHYRQVTSVPLQIVTHDGTDVPIYSRGPMSHLLHSTHEQHYIYNVITYAACLGSYRTQKHCTDHVYTKYSNAQAYLRDYQRQLTSGAITSYPLFRRLVFLLLFLFTVGYESSR